MPSANGLRDIVMRTGGSMGVVTVAIVTTDGTATAGEDYAVVAETLTLEEGETSKSLSLSMVDDGVPEGSETIILTLSEPGGGARLGTRKTSVVIRDGD